MCKPKKEGGVRCYSHTRKEYEASLKNLAAVEVELDRKRAIMSGLNAEMAALDHAYEDGEVDDETYNREIDRISEHQRRGKELLAEDEEKIAVAQKRSNDALAEMRTTHTGLMNLRTEIKEESDPAKKRTLEGIYKVSRRINMRRKKARTRFIANQELAEKLHEKAEAKKAEALAIDPTTSPEHARERDEIILEAKRLSAEAYLAKNNGNMESQALFNAKTGDIVPAKLVDGKYGKAWALLSDPRNPNSAPKKLISPPRGKTYASRAAFWEGKGMKLGTVWVPGEVQIQEDEFGNKEVIVSRTDGGFYPYAVRGNPDVYADKMKEEAAQQKKQKKQATTA